MVYIRVERCCISCVTNSNDSIMSESNNIKSCCHNIVYHGQSSWWRKAFLHLRQSWQSFFVL
mgnify:CR=1 FL=1